MSTSDRIDRVVTSRLLDLPIFAAIMVLVYHISISIVGDWLTNWMNGVSPQGQTGGCAGCPGVCPHSCHAATARHEAKDKP